MLEEYLRGSDNRPKPLSETPGLAEASQRVTNPNTGLFGFENEGETTRTLFESWKKDTNAMRANNFLPIPGIPDMPRPKSYRDWVDYKLLPPFDRFVKYFNFSV